MDIEGQYDNNPTSATKSASLLGDTATALAVNPKQTLQHQQRTAPPPPQYLPQQSHDVVVGEYHVHHHASSDYIHTFHGQKEWPDGFKASIVVLVVLTIFILILMYVHNYNTEE